MLNISNKSIPYQKNNVFINSNAINEMTKVVNKFRNMSFDPKYFSVHTYPSGLCISGKPSTNKEPKELPFDILVQESNVAANTISIKVANGSWIRTLGSSDSQVCSYITEAYPEATGYGDFGTIEDDYILQSSNIATNVTSTNYIVVESDTEDINANVVPNTIDSKFYVLKLISDSNVTSYMQDAIDPELGVKIYNSRRVIGKIEIDATNNTSTITQLYHGDIQDQPIVLDSQLNTSSLIELKGHSYTPKDGIDHGVPTKNALQDYNAYETLIKYNNVFSTVNDEALISYKLDYTNGSWSKKVSKDYLRFDSVNASEHVDMCSSLEPDRSSTDKWLQLYGFNGNSSYFDFFISDFSGNHEPNDPEFLVRRYDSGVWKLSYAKLQNLQVDHAKTADYADEVDHAKTADYADEAGMAYEIDPGTEIPCDQIVWKEECMPFDGRYWKSGDGDGSTTYGALIRNNAAGTSGQSHCINLTDRQLLHTPYTYPNSCLDFNICELQWNSFHVMKWAIDDYGTTNIPMLYGPTSFSAESTIKLIDTKNHIYFDAAGNSTFRLYNERIYNESLDTYLDLINGTVGYSDNIVANFKEQTLSDFDPVDGPTESIDWSNRTFKNGAGTIVQNYNTNEFFDSAGTISYNSNERVFVNAASEVVLDYSVNQLKNAWECTGTFESTGFICNTTAGITGDYTLLDASNVAVTMHIEGGIVTSIS